MEARRRLTVKPSGGRVTCWGTLCSGTERPGQTHTKPSASDTGSVETEMPRQKAVEGIFVQLPLPSYCQPWYGHWMHPSTTDPCATPESSQALACFSLFS